MLESTLHSLIVARTLLEQADPLCSTEDRYLASTGLIVLQDVLEAVLYALLLERGIDDEKNLERKSFDELLGELKAAGVTVPRSGTLKALNKQRVLVKHYAQLAEPAMVRTYYAAAQEAISSMTLAVLGQTLRDLFIANLLHDAESKIFLKAAEQAIKERRYLDALIETRKAIFVEFEEEYSIYGWRDYDDKKQEGILSSAARGGWRAPIWTRNSEWIEKNVKVPTDYVQIDQQNWRLQAMELGIHTVELHNLQRLTPSVFRMGRNQGWSITYDVSFGTSNGTDSNARYCLDRAVSIILKKQQHGSARREPSQNIPFDPPPIYLGHTLHKRPAIDSPSIHVVQEGFNYFTRRVVGGFDPAERFFEVFAESEKQSDKTLLGGPAEFASGYLLIRQE
ncbi:MULTISPECIES: hypothetical protein [Pseudomonas]|uniref:Uncharacterized protein n=1 Tax=Pseudomonas rhizophila TaxID=2045200 RepID=A0ABN5JVQ2_9PSED|nr:MULTISPECIES: hypothetical protein [Pseudomonas]AVU77447.1 hypothetical protein CRX69_20545 [Pseudomonas rhizophila]